MAKLLIRPASADLVHAALDALSATSSPGIDGFTGAIYKCFSGHFVPLMHQIYQSLLDNPTLPETWSMAMPNPIPKTAGLPGVQDLRPLVRARHLFLPFPTRACFCPHLTKQFGVPSRRVQEFGPSFAPSL